MTTQILDVTVYGPGDELPADAWARDTLAESLKRGGHVAFLEDGDWMATYVPGSTLEPGRPGASWESLEEFHAWIRWARS